MRALRQRELLKDFESKKLIVLRSTFDPEFLESLIRMPMENLKFPRFNPDVVKEYRLAFGPEPQMNSIVRNPIFQVKAQNVASPTINSGIDL